MTDHRSPTTAMGDRGQTPLADAVRVGIRINDRWRICFTWRNGDAYDVEIVDYH